MIGVATNVLVRYLTLDDAQQSAIASKYLDQHCTQEQPGYINRIVQCELVWVLGRAYKYSRKQIAYAQRPSNQTERRIYAEITIRN